MLYGPYVPDMRYMRVHARENRWAASYEPASLVTGRTLLCFFRSAGATAISWPTGWTEIAESNVGSGSDYQAIAWREVDGTETGSFIVTHANEKSVACVYQISGAADPDTDPPEASTPANAEGAIDSPDFTPAGGSKDYLWFSIS